MRQFFSWVREIQLGGLICSSRLEDAANFILYYEAEIIICWNLFVLGIDLQLYQVFFGLPDFYLATADEQLSSVYLL
jgi:hypothetical protein